VPASAIGGETRETVVTQDIVAVWNCGSGVARAVIGQPPIGYAWVRVLDTALAAPADCALAYINLAGPQGTYLVAPHAVVLLELAPAPEGLPPTAEQVEAARAVAARRAARIPEAARPAAQPSRAPTQPQGRTTKPPAPQEIPQEIQEPPPSESELPMRPSTPARPSMPSQPTFRPPP
jgi:hypothetical protein